MGLESQHPESYSNSTAYLDNIRYSVTKRFCIFCFALALLSVPASFTSKIQATLIINSVCVLFYAIPLVMVFKSRRHVRAAQAFLCAAMTALLLNQIATNFDTSLPTVAWYFVYIVFAALVLNLGWAIAIAGTGLFSVTLFTIFRLTGLIQHHSVKLEHSLVVGTLFTYLVVGIMLLYLLTMYKRLRDIMVRAIVESNAQKSRLVGVLSHDMRNYLGAISGMVSVIKTDLKPRNPDALTESISGSIDLIQTASSQALLMVEEFVSIARDEIDDKGLHLQSLCSSGAGLGWAPYQLCIFFYYC